LCGPGSWEQSLQVLSDSDIRSYQDPEKMKAKTGRKGTLEDSMIPQSISGDGIQGDEINLLNDRTKRDGTGLTRRTLSWIWMVDNNTHNTHFAENNADILRSEWARSRARANRATEEVALLREEMRRVLAFLNWKAWWWSSKQASRVVQDVVLTEGLQAYAIDQASLQRQLQESFRVIWKEPLE
ncbi:hypothetical protein GALMADRAFT_15264, partial [Galerina marginata CBS 339.88]